MMNFFQFSCAALAFCGFGVAAKAGEPTNLLRYDPPPAHHADAPFSVETDASRPALTRASFVHDNVVDDYSFLPQIHTKGSAQIIDVGCVFSGFLPIRRKLLVPLPCPEQTLYMYTNGFVTKYAPKHLKTAAPDAKDI